MAKVSILVAAYNVEKYIAQTLQSCVDQTLEDIEILVVDDASTDTTKDIIESFASQDGRVRLLTHEQNKGLLLARKTAYTVATGDYIMFLDGDDFLATDACENAYNVAIKENADIVQFSVEIHVEQNTTQSTDALKNFETVFQVINSSIFATQDGGLFTNERIQSISHTVLCKLFSKELIQKVSAHMPEKHIYFAEDMLFSFIAFYYAKSLFPLPKKLYCYRFGTGISTTKDIPLKKASLIAPSYQVYLEMEKFADSCPYVPVHMQTKLHRSKKELLLKLCHMLMTQVAEKDRNDILDIILQHCPKTEFASGLLYAINNIGIMESEELAEFCHTLFFTQTLTNQIKNIGVINTSHFDTINNFIPFAQDKTPTVQCSFDELTDYAHQLENFIKVQTLDAIIDCGNDPNLILTNLLLCKIHNIPFFVRFNIPLQSTFDATAYGIRKLLTLHRILNCCDGVIPYSDADKTLLSGLGVFCTELDNLTISTDKTQSKNDLQISLQHFFEEIISRVSSHSTEQDSMLKELTENLKNSVAYSKSLEQQLKESTEYAKNLEQQLRDSVEYGHNLERQLEEKKHEEIPSEKGKFANLFKR